MVSAFVGIQLSSGEHVWMSVYSIRSKHYLCCCETVETPARRGTARPNGTTEL